MPIIVQTAWYTRQQIQSQPADLFAWGDNLRRTGGSHNPKSGQAFACRGEPNAIGIPTKHAPSNVPGSFFRDCDFATVKPPIDAAFLRLVEHLRSNGTVYWPAEGIGTGRAKLAVCSPRIWHYVERCRIRLFELAAVETR